MILKKMELADFNNLKACMRALSRMVHHMDMEEKLKKMGITILVILNLELMMVMELYTTNMEKLFKLEIGNDIYLIFIIYK